MKICSNCLATQCPPAHSDRAGANAESNLPVLRGTDLVPEGPVSRRWKSLLPLMPLPGNI